LTAAQSLSQGVSLTWLRRADTPTVFQPWLSEAVDADAASSHQHAELVRGASEEAIATEPFAGSSYGL
jgi:hypothetical protein